MKLEVNITKKYFFVLLGALILAGGAFLVNAYDGTQPKVVGHSSGEVDVNIGGTIKTLQQAIDDGDFASSDVDSALNYLNSVAPQQEIYFGGMWGEPDTGYTNPLAGNTKSCPPGYIDRQILGAPYVDHDLHVCIGIPGDVVKVAEFGGMWSNTGALYPNPLTGSNSCPPGYTDKQVTGVSDVDFSLHFCYSTNLNNPVVEYFGGAWGGPDIEYTTSLFGDKFCPLKYTEKQVLGFPGIDPYDVFYCYDPIT